MENKNNEKFMWEVRKSAKIAEVVAEKLSDDVALALSTISCIIDLYADKIGRPSSELWHEMNEVASSVHEQFGDFKEDQE